MRVRRGTLIGLEGILQRIKGGYRVVVAMELPMQSVSVEMEMDDLELIEAAKSTAPGVNATIFQPT